MSIKGRKILYDKEYFVTNHTHPIFVTLYQCPKYYISESFCAQNGCLLWGNRFSHSWLEFMGCCLLSQLKSHDDTMVFAKEIMETWGYFCFCSGGLRFSVTLAILKSIYYHLSPRKLFWVSLSPYLQIWSLTSYWTLFFYLKNRNKKSFSWT